MMRLLYFLTLILTAVSCTEELPNRDPEIGIELQNILDLNTGNDRLVGASVSIRVGREERWSLVSGESNAMVPVASDMKFGIASITKTAVAAAVLRIEEEGLLSIDDPISLYLDLDNPNIDESITIFQLLNHYSGLKGYFHHPDIWPRIEGALETGLEPIELVDYVGEPNFAPGEKFQYSNSNYLILGLIIEAVKEKSVGQVLREYFWTSLGLNDTYFGSDETVEGPTCDAWRDSDGDGTIENITDQYGPAYHSVFYTAADIFTTASDLSLWCHELYDGSALSEVSRDKMTEFRNIDSGSPFWDGYGLGIRRFNMAGKTVIGHTGGMRGYGSYMIFEPESRISIVLLNNQSRTNIGPILRWETVEKMLDLLLDKNL